jgi:indole-3-glycerol phosphate synthase
MSGLSDGGGADLLGRIVAATRQRLAESPYPASGLAEAGHAPRADAFAAALVAGPINVIAECKRRSPLKGLLREDYNPVAIARAYERAGAAAISVLTEPVFFDGSLDHLRAVREAVKVPLLRKDFILESSQVRETSRAGADAVLLILSILDDVQLSTLLAEARGAGLAVLIEVHDEVELERAVRAGATLIGVNARDLRTLDVELSISCRLSPLIPHGAVAVAESGISTCSDIERLRDAGYKAFLVGEHLMRSADPGRALSLLLEDTKPLHGAKTVGPVPRDVEVRRS